MKKKANLTLETVIVAILLLIVLVVSIYIYTKYVNKGAGTVDDTLNNINNEDYDNDGIPNLFDKCPCDAGEMQQCATPVAACKDRLKTKK